MILTREFFSKNRRLPCTAFFWTSYNISREKENKKIVRVRARSIWPGMPHIQLARVYISGKAHVWIVREAIIAHRSLNLFGKSNLTIRIKLGPFLGSIYLRRRVCVRGNALELIRHLVPGLIDRPIAKLCGMGRVTSDEGPIGLILGILRSRRLYAYTPASLYAYMRQISAGTTRNEGGKHEQLPKIYRQVKRATCIFCRTLRSIFFVAVSILNLRISLFD